MTVRAFQTNTCRWTKTPWHKINMTLVSLHHMTVHGRNCKGYTYMFSLNMSALYIPKASAWAVNEQYKKKKGNWAVQNNEGWMFLSALHKMQGNCGSSSHQWASWAWFCSTVHRSFCVLNLKLKCSEMTGHGWRKTTTKCDSALIGRSTSSVYSWGSTRHRFVVHLPAQASVPILPKQSCTLLLLTSTQGMHSGP